MLKKYRWLIFIILVLIGVGLILYGFNVDVFSILKGTDWIVLLTFLTLIYSIFRDSKERNKSIESATLSSNQLEFEKRLYDVLKIYDDLISEASTMFFDTSLEDKIVVPMSTIFKFKDMPVIYKLKLGKMKNDIYYFYRVVESDHIYLNKLVNEIEGLNKKLFVELMKFMDLAVEAMELYKNSINEREKINMYRELNIKRNTINKTIIELINERKDRIYENARLCIKERMTIIREEGI